MAASIKGIDKLGAYEAEGSSLNRFPKALVVT